MAEVVVSALLSSSLQVAFERLASRQVLEFFIGRKLNEKLPQKLRMVMRSINPVIADAELKQFSDSYVKAWLDDVRDAVLDAEDLLDEIDIQVTQTNLQPHSDQEVESNLKEVLDRLEDLKGQKDDLGLKKVSGASVASVLKKVESTSHLAESDNVIYGRDDDKEIIFNWLKSSSENDNKVSIISIVGMGGLGKTTLAQHAYQSVKDKFDVQAWVCVSDDFDVTKLTNAILVAITKSNADYNWQQRDMLHGRLKEALTGKKFLLVLDDVWNEKRDHWEAVQTPLNYGARGSKILVTTRSTEVAASCMRSDKIHHLKQLQEDHCWKLLVKHAFGHENPQVKPEFKKIGLHIVEKCKGLPLALKTIGSLLFTKSSLSEWESVLKSEVWQLPDQHNHIIPALLLSYHHLPSHLKKCFAFCALFPKDFCFYREELALLWMGENYLQCCNQNKSMEEVGKEYFDDLVSRSFFQQSSEVSKYYIMHDLLNDLAKYVCGDIYFTLEDKKAESIPVKTRHFSFLTNSISNLEGSNDSHNYSRLSTFLPLHPNKRLGYSEYGGQWCYGAPICDLFLKCRLLRVLSLRNNDDLTEVPDSVGNLKHLRSLDLSGTPVKKLSDSTCSLFNLQILKLRCCRSLEELPVNLHKLTKLQHLDLRRTKLRKLPMHLGRLKNLQVLTGSFCLDKRGEFRIQQLGEVNLRGKLLISEMQNMKPSDALAANFKSKMNLVRLELEWNENHDDSKQEKEVLENLRPSKELKELRMKNYGGSGFPNWFGDGSLSNVVSLELSNFEYCTWLPSLGQLPYLKKLSIRGLSLIVDIGGEFYGSNSSSFASLEILVFESMKEWKKWDCKAVTGAFPKLRQLSIENCPELEEPLPEQLPCLERLRISSCKELGKIGQKIEERGRMETVRSDGECMEVSSVDYYFPNPIQHSHNFLVDLSIEDCCESLTTFPLDFFPNLHFLCLKRCDNLQMISHDQPHNHLQKLALFGCPQFESFPIKGLSAPRLEKFSISGLKNLKSLPKQMDIFLPSLIHLSIEDCPEAESISDESLPLNLKALYLWECSKLMASLKRALGANTSIQRLSISKMDVKCFPDEGFLPPFLTSLQIIGCLHLKRLDYKGLCHASSLARLRLDNCPNIECLSEEGLPKSISSLTIYGLQNLKSLPKQMDTLLPSLIELKIHNCPEVESISDEPLPSNLKQLYLSGCSKLMASLKEALAANTSIEGMIIEGMDPMESFPDEGFLPPSLIFLRIANCRDLKRLNYRGLCHLSTLTGLTLYECPSIECLPEKGLPKSISSLYVYHCPLLKQRCQKPNGQDWGKIAHIQHLRI